MRRPPARHRQPARDERAPRPPARPACGTGAAPPVLRPPPAAPGRSGGAGPAAGVEQPPPALFETTTVTIGDVAELPAPSRATALSACGPFGTSVVSQFTESAGAAPVPSTASPSFTCRRTRAAFASAVALAV